MGGTTAGRQRLLSAPTGVTRTDLQHRNAGAVRPLHMKTGIQLMKTGNKYVSHRNMICPQIGVTIVLTALSLFL